MPPEAVSAAPVARAEERTKILAASCAWNSVVPPCGAVPAQRSIALRVSQLLAEIQLDRVY